MRNCESWLAVILRLAWKHGPKSGLARARVKWCRYKILPSAVAAVHDLVSARLPLFGGRTTSHFLPPRWRDIDRAARRLGNYGVIAPLTAPLRPARRCSSRPPERFGHP